MLTPPPAEVEATLGLSREDWRKLQQSLNTLGFDTRSTDGRPGRNTREAILAWQRSKGQEATGYLAGPQRDLILSEAQPKLAALEPGVAAQPAYSVARPLRPAVRSWWDKTLGGKNTDAAEAVAALPDGSLVVAGKTESKGVGEKANWTRTLSWVLRLDADGRLLWDKTLSEENRDAAEAVAVLPDGSLVVAGKIKSKGVGDQDAWQDAWVFRLDADGRLLWDKTFGGKRWDGAEAVAALPDGGLAVVGETHREGGNDPLATDAWVLRLDADGRLLWDKTFGFAAPDGRLLLDKTFGRGKGQTQDSAKAVAALPDGSLAVAGDTAGMVAWVLRFDADGRLLWDKTLGGKGSDQAWAVAALPDGSLVVAGSTTSKGAGEGDAWVLRLDADGRLLWDKTFGGKSWDGAWAVAALPDGSLAVAGSTTSKGVGDQDAWVLRLDADGRLLWDKTFGGKSWGGC